jgi:hypothetical protein
MRLGRRIAVGVVMLAVAAAAHARSVSLEADDDDGVIVIGFNSGQEEFELRFSRYNAETRTVERGRTTIEHDGPVDQMTYYVVPIDAGTHVLRSIHSWTEREIVFCMAKSTYAFDVRPGQALYLGDYSIFGGGTPAHPDMAKFPKESIIIVPSLRRLADNLEAAKAALAAHPRVKVELQSAALRPAQFDGGKGQQSCG